MAWRFAVLAIAGVACGRISFDPAAAADTDAVAIDGPSIDAAPGAWLGGFTRRKAIEVTAGGTATLADFPVGILEAADPDLAAYARADGADISVTAGDGVSRLDSELVSFTPATGALEMWARVPSLPPTATRLYLYFGGAPTTSTTTVWSSRFSGVWHMSDAGNGARDSTGHANHLRAVGAGGEPGHGAGVGGRARNHDGVDDRLDIPDPPDGSLDFGVAAFSYGMWVNQVAALNSYDMAFYRGGASAIHRGFCIMLGTGDWEAKLHDGTQMDNVFFGQQPALTNRWVHLVAVVDRSTAKLIAYTNGVVAGINDVMVGSLATDEPFSVGFGPTGAQPFRGSIDEVRIYDGALDADWIAAEYANLTKPGFVSFGPAETPGI